MVPIDVQKCCLVVIDGWGIPQEPFNDESDAIRAAKTPNMSRLMNQFPSTQLIAHGRAVGLPTDLMGNSEVGHLNIGAGRVVFQDIVRIDMAIENGSMEQNSSLIDAFKRANEGNGRLHFVGLVSDGGVHSHINHLKALLRYAKNSGVPHSYVHVITDGRDTNPTSAVSYIKDLMHFIGSVGYGSIATVVGRYYAMDRDSRWERVKIAFDAMTEGIGTRVEEKDLVDVVKIKYEQTTPETDEFLTPMIINPTGLMEDNDVVVFFNFRSDRMRQLVGSFGLGVDRLQFRAERYPSNLFITCMTSYNADFPFPIISMPQKLDNVLAEWLSTHSIKQYHVAETEKYAHVTFFFNGGREVKFVGEDRVVVPSPKVTTYDLEPAMSVAAVADQVIKGIERGNYPFVMCNFAPPDMVGHTGKYEPTIKAVEATDTAIGKVFEACQQNGYILVITADHGNAEKMKSDRGEPHTAHTCAPVPLIIANPSLQLVSPPGREAALCDVAPTVLDLMGLPIPEEMTGRTLLVHH